MSKRSLMNDFAEWAENDKNKSKMQKALREHPDLARDKDWVSFDKFFSLLTFKIQI